MSLRMNLYGCQLAVIQEAVGSESDAFFETASSRVAEVLKGELDRARAVAWLATLIHTGYPLRSTRPGPSVSDDGNLLVSHLETEIHVFALHCLIQAVRRDDWLDLSGQSSHWHHTAMTSLQNELAACGFTTSREYSLEFIDCMKSLIHGAPLFGDDFRTSWSYYSVLETNELVTFTQTLNAALNFERPLSKLIPDHLREKVVVRLSDDAHAFATELSGWLTEIAGSGQDAYILWS